MRMNDLILRASIDGFTFYDLLADFFLSSEHIKIGRFICGAGAIPRTAWIRTVTAAIPTRFSSKMVHMLVSAHWLRTQCGRAPENWRFEYECPPTLETECPLANQTTSTGQTLAVKVTPSPLKSVGGPGGKNNSGRGRPIMTEDRSTGG